jgi:hypothetical protein
VQCTPTPSNPATPGFREAERFTVIGWVNIGDLLISAQDERAAITPLAEAVAVASPESSRPRKRMKDKRSVT